MYPYEWWKLVRYLLIITAFITIALLAGCATVVPFNQCVHIHDTLAEVTKCEDKSIRYEDYRIKRALIQAERRACVMPRLWDDRSRQCKTGDTMIW